MSTINIQGPAPQEGDVKFVLWLNPIRDRALINQIFEHLGKQQELKSGVIGSVKNNNNNIANEQQGSPRSSTLTNIPLPIRSKDNKSSGSRKPTGVIDPLTIPCPEISIVKPDNNNNKDKNHPLLVRHRKKSLLHPESTSSRAASAAASPFFPNWDWPPSAGRLTSSRVREKTPTSEAAKKSAKKSSATKDVFDPFSGSRTTSSFQLGNPYAAQRRARSQHIAADSAFQVHPTAFEVPPFDINGSPVPNYFADAAARQLEAANNAPFYSGPTQADSPFN